MATASAPTPQHSVTLPQMLPIICASTLGTAIEWYDFFLYSFFSATVFPRLFFPNLNPVAGAIASFTTNFVGFAARPLGGAFFGWFGDRVGRKATLAATLLLMGMATALIGIMPGYTSIGLAAPILISILRFLQGVGVGGEWGGSVLLSLEYGDNRRRGFWASWPQTGVPIGLAMAALAVLLFEILYPADAFIALGWRIPFLLSIFLILVGLYIRLRILETPSFLRVLEEKRISKVPLIDVFRYNWKEIVLSTLLRSGEQAPFYIFTTFVFSYGAAGFEEIKGSGLHLELSLLYTGIVVAAGVSFITIPTFSYLSDLVGRKRWYLIGTVIMAAIAFPYFLILNTRIPALVILTITLSLGICHAWVYGPQAALIAERFGTKVRYSGASLGYQLASITAGGPAPIIAVTLITAYHSYVPIALYIVIMAVISFISVLLLREYASKAAAEDVDEPAIPDTIV
jgi:MFS family permease